MTEFHDPDEKIIVTNHGVTNALDELIKAGIWFTVPGANTSLYTGDLFFNMVSNRFSITGIPTCPTGLRHAVKESEPGPFYINLYIKEVIHHIPDNGQGYASLEFIQAHAAGTFMSWMEEWWGGRAAEKVAREHWTVAGGVLAWQK
jgi:hypothetical protein